MENSSMATHSPRAVAENAEALKSEKYKDLPSNYMFVPIAAETSGVLGPRILQFIKNLGRQIRNQTGEPKSTLYIIQRLAVAIQRGNSLCIFGTH